MDEGHTIEELIVKYNTISISKRHYNRYIRNFGFPSKYDYDDKHLWIDFLIKLEAQMYILTDMRANINTLLTNRKNEFKWEDKTKISDYILSEE